jgi:hypothetical protein
VETLRNQLGSPLFITIFQLYEECGKRCHDYDLENFDVTKKTYKTNKQTTFIEKYHLKTT